MGVRVRSALAVITVHALKGQRATTAAAVVVVVAVVVAAAGEG